MHLNHFEYISNLSRQITHAHTHTRTRTHTDTHTHTHTHTERERERAREREIIYISQVVVQWPTIIATLNFRLQDEACPSFNNIP